MTGFKQKSIAVTFVLFHAFAFPSTKTFAQPISRAGMKNFSDDYNFLTQHTPIIMLQRGDAALAVAPAYFRSWLWAIHRRVDLCLIAIVRAVSTALATGFNLNQFLIQSCCSLGELCRKVTLFVRVFAQVKQVSLSALLGLLQQLPIARDD